ncbi:MAG: hypothetical protein ACJ0J5_05140 [Dehalococcoidia bacterium]|jgi:hypothetical protein|tara:strand:+ start:393 stop:611 length:219 start_codon:yes stop_codon:yes gene_type:complete
MFKNKEYIYYELKMGYKVIKLSLLGDYITDDVNIVMKNAEAMFKRVYPEKSMEIIKNIFFFSEEELLNKIKK